MATPPLIQPSTPHSPAGTSTSIPVSTPPLPSTKTEQEQAAVTVGSTVIQVELEQQEQTTGDGESEDVGLIKCCSVCCLALFQCLSPCFKCAWSCVQLWTPLTATFLIYWLIYRPDRFHPRIDSAVLAAFDLTNTSLQYDLAIDLSFRNSHRLAIRYLDVAASVFYNGTRLGPTDDALPSFIQGRKNTTVHYTTPEP